jgi:flagellar basal body-associated protein FliL
MKNLLLVGAVGVVVMTGVGAGAWYYTGIDQRAKVHAEAVSKTAEAERFRREEEPHRLTLVSHVSPTVNGRRMSSVPVMVKLVVLGSNGLKAVCARMPHVKEAVLRTFSRGGASDGSGRIDLAGYESSLRQAIDQTVPGKSIKSLNAFMLNTAGVGVGMRATAQKCENAFKP